MLLWHAISNGDWTCLNRNAREYALPLRLPNKVYAKHGAFYYVHPDGRWERLGTDLADVKRKAFVYNDPNSTYGTMAYFLDAFVVHCERRVHRGDLAPRTYQDYKSDAEPLKAYFGWRV